MKSDHIKEIMTFTDDNIKRLSHILHKCVSQQFLY